MRRIFLLVPLAWTLFILVLVALSVRNAYSSAERIATAHAQETLAKDLAYRQWAAGHGGVYVPVTPDTPPNPFLSHIPERDILTPSGRKLTLMNPAYMTRQVHARSQAEYGIRGHITSLNPIRPQNAADDWEKEALQEFARGREEVSSHDWIGGAEYFRLMRPLLTQPGCLKCHEEQGYAVGDIRGGISVAVPWAHMKDELRRSRWAICASFGAVWAIGLFGLALSWRVITRQISELQTALDEVKTLSGLIPICASCKKIRNDAGFWQSIEKYLSTHTEARLSHGICPDCGVKLYGDLYREESPKQPPGAT